jgi:dTDP-4-amino-4,6-dideoxygalactose transaminase
MPKGWYTTELIAMSDNSNRNFHKKYSSEVELSKILQRLYGVDNWIYTGRASGALYLLLLTICKPGDTVALPNITCHDLAQTIISAGLKPEFLDISLRDYNLDISNLQKSLDKLQVKPKALVAVHSFGHKIDIESISRICKINEIFLVEDVCQIPPYNWKPSKADAVLTSFGHTKPIGAGGGGALGLADSGLFGKIKLLKRQWDDKPLQEHAALVFYEDYYELLNSIKLGKSKRHEISALLQRNQSLIIRGTRKIDFSRVISSYSNLTDLSNERIAKANYARKLMAPIEEIMLPEYLSNTVPWRITFLISEKFDRDKILTQLRSQNLRASSWYRALSSDFESLSNPPPNSKVFEERVINLWVDYSADYSYLNDCYQVIKVCMNPVNRDFQKRNESL